MDCWSWGIQIFLIVTLRCVALVLELTKKGIILMHRRNFYFGFENWVSVCIIHRNSCLYTLQKGQMSQLSFNPVWIYIRLSFSKMYILWTWLGQEMQSSSCMTTYPQRKQRHFGLGQVPGLWLCFNRSISCQYSWLIANRLWTRRW